MASFYLKSYLIIWRESFEALLVIFLILSLIRNHNSVKLIKNFLAAGVFAGLAISVLIAWILLQLDGFLDQSWAQFVTASLPLVAAGLMIQMIFWMRQKSKELTSDIKGHVESKTPLALSWAVFGIVTFAIAREGFETLIYLYGVYSSESLQNLAAAQLSGILILGVGSAGLVLWMIFSKVLKFLSMKTFFNLSNAILIVLAIGLAKSGVEQIYELLRGL